MKGLISFQLQEGRAPRTAEIRTRMAGALPKAVTDEMAGAIRRGPGSVTEQFARQAEMALAASFPWKRTQDFGSRRAPSKTLHDRGQLEAAWTGAGAGARTINRPNGVEIGVDSRMFPQAAVFQRNGITLIPVTPKSRMFLGLEFGVWLKRSTTRIKVEGRPVSINRTILQRVRKIVGAYYLHGEVVTARAAA